jgi:hypothetical protein
MYASLIYKIEFYFKFSFWGKNMFCDDLRNFEPKIGTPFLKKMY